MNFLSLKYLRLCSNASSLIATQTRSATLTVAWDRGQRATVAAPCGLAGCSPGANIERPASVQTSPPRLLSNRLCFDPCFSTPTAGHVRTPTST